MRGEYYLTSPTGAPPEFPERHQALQGVVEMALSTGLPAFADATADYLSTQARALEEDITPPKPATRETSFLFCYHSLGNAEMFASQLPDTNVLALEAASDQLGWERPMNVFLSNTSSEAEKSAAWGQIDQIPLRYMLPIAQELKGSGKEIRLIDLPLSSATTALQLRATQKAEVTVHRALAGHASNETLRQAITQLHTTIVSGFPARKETILDQIRQLEQECAQKGKSLGVVLGALHTDIQHTFAKERHQTSRSFALHHGVSPLQPEAGPARVRYSYDDERMRQMLFKPGADDPALLDRIVLQRHFVHYGFFDMQQFPPSMDYLPDNVKHAYDTTQAELLAHMPDKAVRSVLTELDEVKRNNQLDDFDKTDSIRKILRRTASKHISN
jgi:hypothetical protein